MKPNADFILTRRLTRILHKLSSDLYGWSVEVMSVSENMKQAQESKLLYDAPNALTMVSMSVSTTGRILINRALINLVKNDDEWAGILGHEASHALGNYNVGNYSDPEIELVADWESVELMVKAGYDPNAYVSLMERTAEHTKALPNTHPTLPWEDRIERVKKYIPEAERRLRA